MKRLVMRVDAAKEVRLAAGTGIRKGQLLGQSPARYGRPVLSPVDGVVETLLLLGEQNAYVLIINPLETRVPAGLAGWSR